MKRALLILLVFTCFLSLEGQDKPSYGPKGQPFFQVLYHQGLHWNRTRYLQAQMENGYRSVDLRFGFQSLGAELWQQDHHYPRLGVGFNFANEVIGSRDTSLSNPYSLYVFYSAPLFREGRFSLHLNISTGLSYMSLVYDPDNNPYNDIVASHINLFFNLNMDLMVQLNQRLDLVLGAGMAHYSNGNLHEPQKGLNNWGLNAGLIYFLGQKQKPFERGVFLKDEFPVFKEREELQFMFAVGITEWQPDNQEYGTHYFASTFSTDYAFRYWRNGALTVGVDVMYDGSLEEVLRLPTDMVSTWQKMYLGGHMGYQYSIKRLTLIFNLGSYFSQTAWNRRWFYGRAGWRLRIADPLSFHVCIKTRDGIRSDWIEWGLALSIITQEKEAPH